MIVDMIYSVNYKLICILMYRTIKYKVTDEQLTELNDYIVITVPSVPHSQDIQDEVFSNEIKIGNDIKCIQYIYYIFTIYLYFIKQCGFSISID